MHAHVCESVVLSTSNWSGAESPEALYVPVPATGRSGDPGACYWIGQVYKTSCRRHLCCIYTDILSTNELSSSPAKEWNRVRPLALFVLVGVLFCLCLPVWLAVYILNMCIYTGAYSELMLSSTTSCIREHAAPATPALLGYWICKLTAINIRQIH